MDARTLVLAGAGLLSPLAPGAGRMDAPPLFEMCKIHAPRFTLSQSRPAMHSARALAPRPPFRSRCRVTCHVSRVARWLRARPAQKNVGEEDLDEEGHVIDGQTNRVWPGVLFSAVRARP